MFLSLCKGKWQIFIFSCVACKYLRISILMIFNDNLNEGNMLNQNTYLWQSFIIRCCQQDRVYWRWIQDTLWQEESMVTLNLDLNFSFTKSDKRMLENSSVRYSWRDEPSLPPSFPFLKTLGEVVETRQIQ